MTLAINLDAVGALLGLEGQIAALTPHEGIADDARVILTRYGATSLVTGAEIKALESELIAQKHMLVYRMGDDWHTLYETLHRIYFDYAEADAADWATLSPEECVALGAERLPRGWPLPRDPSEECAPAV